MGEACTESDQCVTKAICDVDNVCSECMPVKEGSGTA